MSKTAIEAKNLAEPGKSKGLLEVFSRRYLLKLLVHKELRARYRGSVLGMLWSYAKPAMQFTVFYFALGVFLKMNRAVDNYAIYLFSGVIMINYFSEVFGNCTRSVVGNAALVKKIYLPRELFPVSSVFVGIAHFLPQLVVLLVGALIYGWVPTFSSILALILAFSIVTIFALGLGILFAALNVLFRDAENFVDIILMITTWICPVLYSWHNVYDVFQGTVYWKLYQLNPLAPAVELFHEAFWSPTLSTPSDNPARMWEWGLIALVTSFIFLIIGELVFRKLDKRFAQEL
ncbi:ABC transporter permease [Actinomyces sp. zg-332]|uniref:ABC transporter permease n=1 Tax=Actinomyces sp. zg-332 TaxID=2708340 RepID=UPI001421F597|nr:ABC transporter permease [Actinomyces sp. zg-332]QPK94535.1 ABC transporter permease [Actinomyces sp. zg-332]